MPCFRGPFMRFGRFHEHAGPRKHVSPTARAVTVKHAFAALDLVTMVANHGLGRETMAPGGLRRSSRDWRAGRRARSAKGGSSEATAPRSARRRTRDGFRFPLRIQINGRFLRRCFDLL